MSKPKFVNQNEKRIYTCNNVSELIVKEHLEPGDRIRFTVITTITTDSYKLHYALKKANHVLTVKWKD